MYYLRRRTIATPPSTSSVRLAGSGTASGLPRPAIWGLAPAAIFTYAPALARRCPLATRLLRRLICPHRPAGPGERRFRFWLTGGPADTVLTTLPRRALDRNEQPMALSFSPSGQGQKPSPLASLSDQAVVMTAAKQADDGGDIIIRLFEPTGKSRQTTLTVPAYGVRQRVNLGPFEINTLRIGPKGKITEVDLLERSV
jgi:hypothetical protein